MGQLMKSSHLLLQVAVAVMVSGSTACFGSTFGFVVKVVNNSDHSINIQNTDTYEGGDGNYLTSPDHNNYHVGYGTYTLRSGLTMTTRNYIIGYENWGKIFVNLPHYNIKYNINEVNGNIIIRKANSNGVYEELQSIPRDTSRNVEYTLTINLDHSLSLTE